MLNFLLISPRVASILRTISWVHRGEDSEARSKIRGAERDSRGRAIMVIKAAPTTVEYNARSMIPALSPKEAMMNPNSPMATMLVDK
jgi:hypothetical protein